MGRVADGASGISSGFCCAISASASNNVSPRIKSALIFLAIPGPLDLSFVSFVSFVSFLLSQELSFRNYFRTFRSALGSTTFSVTQMPMSASMVHLTMADPYRPLQDRLAKSRDKDSDA
jgi:hypothetical protein